MHSCAPAHNGHRGTSLPEYPEFRHKKEYTINDLKPDINFEIGVFTNNLNELTPVAKEFVRILKENIV